MPDNLEQCIEALKNPVERRMFIQQVIVDIEKYHTLPEGSSDALESLIADYSANALKDSYIIVEYDIKATVPPVVSKSRNRVTYELRLFSKRFSLGSFKTRSPEEKITASVTVSKGTISVDYYYNGRLYNYTRNLPDNYFSVYRIYHNKVLFCSGVAVKETSGIGHLRFAGKQKNLGIENRRKPIIVFFDRGELFYYTFDGEMVFEALSIQETKQQPVLRRCTMLKKEEASFDIGKFASEVKECLLLSWKKYPKGFSRFGRTVVLSLTNTCQILAGGNISLNHYRNGVAQDGFFTAARLFGQDAAIKINGPYVFLYHGKRMINAYKEPDGIEVRCLTQAEPVHVVTLRKLTDSRFHRISVNGTSYLFYKKKLEAAAGSLDGCSKAIIANINQIDDNYDFKLYVRRKGFVEEFSIEPALVRYREKLLSSSKIIPDKKPNPL